MRYFGAIIPLQRKLKNKKQMDDNEYDSKNDDEVVAKAEEIKK